ncbi:MAG: FKBP-type peptidyl-prolyl cis-trans isomerase [Lachnospiraceae bacterium]|nr:FKBP-type peptidyl-prolyl cis-trans isomerase [Lachnospiraceae bacterium]
MAKNKNINAAENKSEASDISKSKAKREQRRKEVAKERRHRRTTKIVGAAVAAVLVVLIAVSAGQNIYLAAMRTTSDSNFSAGLTTDGKIEGANVKDLITLVDYANIPIPADEVAATDEEVEESITSTLASHKEQSTDETLEIQDGDVVNIDFVGSVDGVEFEGGSSGGAGYTLTIGSGSFVDDFEQQLIGHKPGENVTVEVTFPDTYTNEELAGKDASFAVTVNSITVTPELTNDYVTAYFSEEGLSTVEEYRAYVENQFYEQHLEDYLTSYIIENSTVKSYPSAYLKALRAVTKYNDEYMLQYYAAIGITIYENVWDMIGGDVTDELSYEKNLRERAKETAKEAMVYQAIYEDAALTIDMNALIAEMTEDYGETYVADMRESNGEGYLAQGEIREAVIDYLMELYK